MWSTLAVSKGKKSFTDSHTHTRTHTYAYIHTHTMQWWMMMMTTDSYPCQWLNRCANRSFLSFYLFVSRFDTFYAYASTWKSKESRRFNDSIGKIWHWSSCEKISSYCSVTLIFFSFCLLPFLPSLSHSLLGYRTIIIPRRFISCNCLSRILYMYPVYNIYPLIQSTILIMHKILFSSTNATSSCKITSRRISFFILFSSSFFLEILANFRQGRQSWNSPNQYEQYALEFDTSHRTFLRGYEHHSSRTHCKNTLGCHSKYELIATWDG